MSTGPTHTARWLRAVESLPVARRSRPAEPNALRPADIAVVRALAALLPAGQGAPGCGRLARLADLHPGSLSVALARVEALGLITRARHYGRGMYEAFALVMPPENAEAGRGGTPQPAR